ncbi:MAG TPA: response regulator [Tepidisphaeraceae bacterium]|nr:response regulator [Tepidisphaeraceae bacterium]
MDANSNQTTHDGANDSAPLVLIVEDNAVNRLIVTKYLQKGNYRHEIAVNGKEGVEAVQRKAFDMVLMDLAMPEMDGLEATRVIRRLESQQSLPRRPGTAADYHLPIIAVTANVLNGNREACYAVGMDDFLSKPLNLQTLLQTMEKHLSQSKSTALQAESPQVVESQVSPALDYTAFLERCLGDVSLLMMAAEQFEQQAIVDIDAVRQAMVRCDLEGVRESAHRLKGAASYLEAEPVRLAAQRVEYAAKDKSIMTAPDLVDVLAKEIERCLVDLRSAVQQARTVHS